MPIKRLYNKNFFKSWNSEMAYILGFLFADGNIIITRRNTHFVSFYTADESLLEKIKHIILSDHKISLRAVRSGNVYRLQIGSKEWFDDLIKLGLVPNKTSRMFLPEIPHDYIGDFVRGYFDGDGNVWVGDIHKNRVKNSKTIQVSFTSGSHDFLVSLRNLLHLVGLKGGGLYVSKQRNFSRLTFSVSDALTIHKIMYNAAHELYLLNRKKQVFEKFVNCGGSSTG
jgi:intein-encoded DNA endonuclease-like protein